MKVASVVKSPPILHETLKDSLISKINCILTDSENLSEEVVLCRELEFSSIVQYIHRNLTDYKYSCLALHGPPGSGKSHTIKSVCFQDDSHFDSFYFNCCSFPSGSHEKVNNFIMNKIISNRKKCSSRKMNAPQMKDAFYAKFIEKNFRGRLLLLIFDEFDQLSKNIKLKVIVSLEALRKNGVHVLFVIIGNSKCNLVDSVIKGIPQQLIQFQPYKQTDLYQIVEDKLKDYLEYVDVSALKFCTMKISSLAKDIRGVLSILSSSLNSSQIEDKVINLRAVKDVLDEVYGCKTVTQSVDVLPIQQLVIMSCLYVLIKRQFNRVEFTKFIDMSEFYNFYSKMCTENRLECISYDNLEDICGILESRDFIEVRSSKSCKKVISLKLSEGDIFKSIGKSDIFNKIIKTPQK